MMRPGIDDEYGYGCSCQRSASACVSARRLGLTSRSPASPRQPLSCVLTAHCAALLQASDQGQLVWAGSDKQVLGHWGFDHLWQALLLLFQMDCSMLHAACKDGVVERLVLLMTLGEGLHAWLGWLLAVAVNGAGPVVAGGGHGRCCYSCCIWEDALWWRWCGAASQYVPSSVHICIQPSGIGLA